MYLYTKRDKILNKIGYNSYKEYLQSALWKTIRRLVLEKHKYICYKCGEYGNEVHHKRYTYSILNGTNLSKKNYYVVCRNCHQEAEYDGVIKKTTKEANKYIGLKPYHIEYKYRDVLKKHNRLSEYTRVKKVKKCATCQKKGTPFKFNGRRVCFGCLPSVLSAMNTGHEV